MCRVLTVIFVILEKTPEYIFIRCHLVFVVINEQLIHAQCWGYTAVLWQKEASYIRHILRKTRKTLLALALWYGCKDDYYIGSSL